MNFKNPVLFFLLILIILTTLKASPVSVGLDDPVYPYLDRMETLGFITHVHDGIKPFTRNEISRYLKALIPQADKLTHIDRRRLQDFLLDYRRELEPQIKYEQTPQGQNWYSVLGSWDNFKKDFGRYFKQAHPEEKNHVFLYEKGKDDFYFDYEQGLTYEQRSDKVSRSASWQKYIFRGTLNANFGYQAITELHGLRGDESYLLDIPILKGAWSERPGEEGARYSDRTGGELFWHTNYLDIQLAQQEVEWGYGESGKLILSRNPEHYPYLSLSKDWGWVKFISLHGKLQSFPQDTLANGQKLYPDKWLAAQRLEISPASWLTLGLNENFIYGNRYVDWAYLFPFNFYRAVQHKLRDRDNATISLDAELLPYAGIKLYGTVFLDEFRLSEIGGNWFGNKQAVLAGFCFADPFGLANLSLRAEYTAIMPWVYTHKYRVNSYTTDYRSLGHWAGPNSEVLYLHLKKEWHQRFSTGFAYRQFKHGANYADENIGGDILLGRGVPYGSQLDATDYKNTRRFLEGILTSERRYSFDAEYEVFNDLYLRARYHFIDKKTGQQKDKMNEFYFGVLFRY